MFIYYEQTDKMYSNRVETDGREQYVVWSWLWPQTSVFVKQGTLTYSSEMETGNQSSQGNRAAIFVAAALMFLSWFREDTRLSESETQRL